MDLESEFKELADLLEKRLEVIGDHDLRDRDPDEQLRQLQSVSEAITAKHRELTPHLKPRLAHFLDNCSYDKALAWLQENPRG